MPAPPAAALTPTCVSLCSYSQGTMPHKLIWNKGLDMRERVMESKRGMGIAIPWYPNLHFKLKSKSSSLS